MSLPKIEPHIEPISILCPYCKHVSIRKVFWIDPADWSKGVEPIKKTVMWCKNSSCAKSFGYRIKMLPDRKVQLMEIIPYKEIYRPDRQVDYSLKTEDEETVNDDEIGSRSVEDY